MNCDEIRELLEEYALDLLAPQQRQAVTQHLDTCSACRQALAEYTDVAAALPSALAVASPHRLPDAVKAQLLQQVDSTKADSVIDVPMMNNVPSVPASTAHHAPQVELSDIKTRGSLWRLRLALAAASLLLLLSLFWSVRLNVILARERALRAEFGELVDQQEIVLEVIDSNETTRRLLLPPTRDSRSYGKVFTRAGMPHVVAMGGRLTPPTAGDAYHLWVMQDGDTELAGVMTVNEAGFGLLVFDEDIDDPAYEQAMVTLQPEGSTAPVDPPVIQWVAPD